MFRGLPSALVLALGVLAVAACRASSPAGGLESRCAMACESHLAQCSTSQCARGCNLVLDRLAEHEGARVLACVSKAQSACDDPTWAKCATRIGPHADGGPPPPRPASDVEDVTEGD